MPRAVIAAASELLALHRFNRVAHSAAINAGGGGYHHSVSSIVSCRWSVAIGDSAEPHGVGAYTIRPRRIATKRIVSHRIDVMQRSH